MKYIPLLTLALIAFKLPEIIRAVKEPRPLRMVSHSTSADHFQVVTTTEYSSVSSASEQFQEAVQAHQVRVTTLLRGLADRIGAGELDVQSLGLECLTCTVDGLDVPTGGKRWTLTTYPLATEIRAARTGAGAEQLATAEQSLHDIKVAVIQVRDVVAGALGIAFDPTGQRVAAPSETAQAPDLFSRKDPLASPFRPDEALPIFAKPPTAP